MILKTGVISHNILLDDPWLAHSKTTQNSVKRHFGPKIFFACGALKGASPCPPQESATLAVTIIPVAPDPSSEPRGEWRERTS